MKHILLLSILIVFSCGEKSSPGAMFSEVPRSKTGIDFRNLVIEKETFNIFKYQYFYNGGGVAVGDFNNDGLQDLVFTGNMVKNRLYLNKGGLEFEDATLASGIAAKEGWCTGVTTVDINLDGKLDLYICRAGYPFDALRKNLLFINKGISDAGEVLFEENAAAYGLDDAGHSTQASFFDYDKDGDLDLFLMNHSTVEYSRGSLDIYQIRNKQNPAFTNKLFRNDQGRFTNVTEQAGITSNVLTFSLGLSTCDINMDGWPDIFIGNDFNEPDYLFINQHDGTFRDELKSRFDHTSLFTMGCDVADFDGDGLPDLVSLDMLPEGNHLQKMHSGVDNFEKVNQMIRSGFYKQYSRNMLQHNNGDGTFSEVGQLAGISNTDWSWASLFFDFDNDGRRDLFVSNGYPRDHTNMDFLKFTADEVLRIQRGEENIGFQDYLKKMPPIIEPNYFFKNEGGLRFSNQTAAWNLSKPVVTQSAAWADLDNDGDLDLMLNNTNEYADILENHAGENPDQHWLRFQLLGRKENPAGTGTKVFAYARGTQFYLEQNPVRGFQASMDPVLHIGLGPIDQVDSIVVVWPGNEKQVLEQVRSNQTLTLNIRDAGQRYVYRAPSVEPVYRETPGALPFQHIENENNDFKRQSLLPWFYSRQGPALAVADLNGDGLDDVFMGGAKGQAGQVLLQQKGNGTFKLSSTFEADAACEDVDACFFDADGDGDQDLYVASGGYEYDEQSPELRDRLYINDRHGHFSKASDALPNLPYPASCVRAADIDGDRDVDLFIGGSVIPGKFPHVAPGRLLLNDGKGRFREDERFLIPPATAGMQDGIASQAVFADLDKDGDPDLVTAGEWSPVRFFENRNGVFSEQSHKHISFISSGLWNTLQAADLDGDGDIDLIAGNLGQNTQLRTKEKEPLDIWFGDFDNNGSVDPLICYFVQGKSYPAASMEDLTGQLPVLRKKFNYFRDYADAQAADILSPEQMKSAGRLDAAVLETIWLENNNGHFERRDLPAEAQIAPVQAIATSDVNGDGITDLILAGNRTNARVKFGSLDGNHGQLFLGDGKGGFHFVPYPKSGLKIRGDVRGLKTIRIAGKSAVVFGVNNGAAGVFTWTR
jgi:hypothetical protein